MAGYVIKRYKTRCRADYVSAPGSKKSYTPDLAHARRFSSSVAAEAHMCPENETVLLVEALLQPITD